MSRDLTRIERHVTISNEAVAAFLRFWLTSTPSLLDSALSAAQTKGRELYVGTPWPILLMYTPYMYTLYT
ncbi:hypothetical protein [Rhizobium hainanense]|uniref:Uncharacterized protein n=1 Tax=Rhizobium hainanense TaxID=52131 RepID=A0A1C3WE40_9HYPH|nr:hypothetical protein GA0061100_11640 [Rhizobium hainanense]